MAQKRMIDKKISVSEQVSNLKPIGMLIYTWMIPHADDAGLLPANPKTIRAMVCPMLDISVEDFGFHLEDMRKQNLIRLVSIENHDYYLVSNFHEYQTLKKDRQPQTLIKMDRSKSPQENWKTLESIVFHLEDKGFLNGSELNGNEVNRSEANGSELKEGESERKPTAVIPPVIPAATPPGSSSNEPVSEEIPPAAKELYTHFEALGVVFNDLEEPMKKAVVQLYDSVYSGQVKDSKPRSLTLQRLAISIDENPEWTTLSANKKIAFFLTKYSQISKHLIKIPPVSS
jgi:hypothetical protein